LQVPEILKALPIGYWCRYCQGGFIQNSAAGSVHHSGCIEAGRIFLNEKIPEITIGDGNVLSAGCERTGHDQQEYQELFSHKNLVYSVFRLPNRSFKHDV